MTALGMLLAGLGIVLVWAAISNRDPRSIIAGTLKR
jgi:hypothetical protein